jgi:hypothetical protein
LQVKIKDDKGRSMMKIYEQIPMSNGLTASVYDLSRQIAADTVKVELVARIPVTLRPDDFSEPSQYERTRAVFGEEIVFEHRRERSFVKTEQKEQVFSAMLETFKQASLPYLSHPQFRTRFAASKYRDILQNPYKYRSAPESRTESA